METSDPVLGTPHAGRRRAGCEKRGGLYRQLASSLDQKRGSVCDCGQRIHGCDSDDCDQRRVSPAPCRDQTNSVQRCFRHDASAYGKDGDDPSYRIDADWVMHLDADEIPHSYRPGETLRQTISRIDHQGYNAIDFNEFVFLPVDFAYQPNYGAPYQPLQHYYFFEPSAPRLMRAWKKVDGFSMIEAGGHNLEGDDIRLAPETLALRHYIFRDQEHAYRKYARRIFAATDLARGWHGNRIAQPVEAFRFPKADRLSRLASPDGYDFDRSHPQLRHYWQWSGI